MIHPPQAYRAISKIYSTKEGGKLPAHRRESLRSLVKYMDSYLKFGFLQCPDTGRLPRPQCVICATVLGSEAMKPSRLIRHLNTKYSDLVVKPTEYLCVKEMCLK